MALDSLNELIKLIENEIEDYTSNNDHMTQIEQQIKVQEMNNKRIHKKLTLLLTATSQASLDDIQHPFSNDHAPIQDSVECKFHQQPDTPQKAARIFMLMEKSHAETASGSVQKKKQQFQCQKCQKIQRKRRFRKLIEGEVLFLKHPDTKRQRCHHLTAE